MKMVTACHFPLRARSQGRLQNQVGLEMAVIGLHEVGRLHTHLVEIDPRHHLHLQNLQQVVDVGRMPQHHLQAILVKVPNEPFQKFAIDHGANLDWLK
jgi:hypothetical protein